MRERWNERYAGKDYVYGKEPNHFFRSTIIDLSLKGSLLLPAEGEGRNAVFAAKRGLQVHAFDFSIEAKRKAEKLAEEFEVKINYQLGEIHELNFEKSSFDAVALIFAHFNPKKRSEIHRVLSELIKPGGYIILEGFSVGNLKLREKNPSIGGPPSEAMLFTEEMIKNDFPHFDPLRLETTLEDLKEGEFHKGQGEVVRYIGRKV